MKRFVGKRELPKLMLSNNSKTFKADHLKAFNTRNRIIWRFNLTKAPWWGRLFERFICSIKGCLRKCVRNCTLTYKAFYTVLVEIEEVLNSRPLTCLDEDDIEEPLIPIHLYCGHIILNPIEGGGYESDLDFNNNCEQALSRKCQLEQVLQSFWKRWRKDYLLKLRSTHVGNKTKESNIKVNDIVTILDENQKRNKWWLQKIEKCIGGKDGIRRRAEVKVAEQNGKTTVIMRPLQKLFLLEMKENEIRPSSNPRMKKTDETNDELSKQIQVDEEKKEANGANNDESFTRFPKNMKQSDAEPLNHGDRNDNVNNRSKCNRRLSKRSAAIDVDWR